MTNEEAISSLKTCQELMRFDPMTGDTHELWQENKDNQNLYNACDIAISALRRANPTNEPLTLDELREMDGQPVWIHDLCVDEIECLQFDRVESATYHSGDDYRFEQFGAYKGVIRWACKYGITWLAYRHKPEGVKEHGRE